MDGMTGTATRHAGESRWFEDFTLGERFVLSSRVLTADMFRDFAHASGEAHPVHTDVDWCESEGLPGLQASTFLVAIQAAAGAGLFPFLAGRSLLGLLEQSSRAVRPAFVGDTLNPVLQVSELVPSGATGIVCLRSMIHNQRRELVMDGQQRWSLRRKPRD